MDSDLGISRDDLLYDYSLLVDYIINWKHKLFSEMPFFDFHFKKNKVHTAMDIDCGAGHYVFAFTNLARFVMGVDTNPFMVRKAQSKNLIGNNYKILNSNFYDFDEIVNNERLEKKYDCIVSLNNGLSLIINDNNFDARFKFIRDHLTQDGSFVLNSFNYNKLLKDEDYTFARLPFIYKGDHYTLIRHMQILDEDLIKYTADVYDSQGNVKNSFEQLQRPLTKGRITKKLEEYGFVVEEVYGDFNFSKFDIDRSRRMILVAKLVGDSNIQS